MLLKLTVSVLIVYSAASAGDYKKDDEKLPLDVKKSSEEISKAPPKANYGPLPSSYHEPSPVVEVENPAKKDDLKVILDAKKNKKHSEEVTKSPHGGNYGAPPSSYHEHHVEVKKPASIEVNKGYSYHETRYVKAKDSSEEDGKKTSIIKQGLKKIKDVIVAPIRGIKSVLGKIRGGDYESPKKPEPGYY